LSATLVGTINLVPKRATDAPLTRLTANYSSNSYVGGHLDVGRRFGADKQWGARFNGIYRDGDTAIDGQSTRFGVATLALDYRGESLRASLDLGYQDIKTKAPTGAAGYYLLDGLPVLRPPKAERQVSQDWEYSDGTGKFLLAKAEYDISSALSVYGAFGIGQNDHDWLANDIFLISAQGDALAQTYRYLSYRDRTAAQAGVRGRIDTGPVQHDFNIGGSYLRESYGYTFGPGYGFYAFAQNIYTPVAVAAPSLAGFPGRPPKTAVTSMPSVAIADTLSILDGRVALTVGGRFQEIKIDAFDTGVASYDKDAFSPSVALVVKPIERLSVYGNYIQGLTRGPTAPANTTNAGEYLPPIKTKQFELGAKYDFGVLAATFDVFQIERPAGAVVANGDGTNTYRVYALQRNRGAELNLFGEPVKGFRIVGGVTYTSARLAKTENGLNDGKTAIAVPEWQLNLSGEWDVPFVPGLSVSGRAIHTSSQFLDAANLRRVPGWTRWDAGLRYALAISSMPIVLRANVENLTGNDYWMTSSEGWLNQALPRTFKLSASFDF
jgi:iron complex outermembrane recepter protein